MATIAGETVRGRLRGGRGEGLFDDDLDTSTFGTGGAGEEDGESDPAADEDSGTDPDPDPEADGGLRGGGRGRRRSGGGRAGEPVIEAGGATDEKGAKELAEGFGASGPVHPSTSGGDLLFVGDIVESSANPKAFGFEADLGESDEGGFGELSEGFDGGGEGVAFGGVGGSKLGSGGEGVGTGERREVGLEGLGALDLDEGTPRLVAFASDEDHMAAFGEGGGERGDPDEDAVDQDGGRKVGLDGEGLFFEGTDGDLGLFEDLDLVVFRGDPGEGDFWDQEKGTAEGGFAFFAIAIEEVSDADIKMRLGEAADRAEVRDRLLVPLDRFGELSEGKIGVEFFKGFFAFVEGEIGGGEGLGFVGRESGEDFFGGVVALFEDFGPSPVEPRKDDLIGRVEAGKKEGDFPFGLAGSKGGKDEGREKQPRAKGAESSVKDAHSSHPTTRKGSGLSEDHGFGLTRFSASVSRIWREGGRSRRGGQRKKKAKTARRRRRTPVTGRSWSSSHVQRRRIMPRVARATITSIPNNVTLA